MEIKNFDGIEGPLIIEPKIFKDDRGYFFESFNLKEFNEKTGIDFYPVQDNESESKYGVLRGLHFQNPPFEQAKLVRVVEGRVFDVAVDIRKNSKTFGKYAYAFLTDENHRQFFIPKGFAHGFLVMSDKAIFQYKCDNYYNKESEDGIRWDCAGIPWSDLVNLDKISLSEKDKNRTKTLSDLNG